MKIIAKTKILLAIMVIILNFGCSQFNGPILVSSYNDMSIIVRISKIKTHQVQYEKEKYKVPIITIAKGKLKINNNSGFKKVYNIRHIYLSADGNVSNSGEIDSVIDYLYKGELLPGTSVVFPMYWIFEDKLEYKEGLKLKIFIFKDLELFDGPLGSDQPKESVEGHIFIVDES
jgi:hypothetical protein